MLRYEPLEDRVLLTVIYNAGGLFLDNGGDELKLLVPQDFLAGGNEFDDGDPTNNSSPGKADGVGPLAINRGISGPLNTDFTPGPGVALGRL